MNEDQLKAVVRHAFSLVDTADRAVLDVDQLLGRVMLQVRHLVETLPEEALFRNKAWTELSMAAKLEMESYTQALRSAVYREEGISAPGMAEHAKREATYAGANITKPALTVSSANVVAMVDEAKIGKASFKRLFGTKTGAVSPWTQGMFNIVDRNVRTGILQGLSTQEIANQVVHETIKNGVPGVTLQGNTSVRQIRAQAQAMARTVTQDINQQIKNRVQEANKDAIKGMIWQHFSALDSRTCQTCAPLSGKTTTDKKTFEDGTPVPYYPIHVNCRCDLVLIDPKDQEPKLPKMGQQISETPFNPDNPGTYKTKVKVKGERFYRQAREFTGNNYGDYLAASNLTTQTEFFGGGQIGVKRARYFRNQLARAGKGKDPMQILEGMLTGPTTARKFIPLP